MNKKTLIVEDNPINAELLKEMLEQLNIETKVLFDGNKVFELLENEIFDLIFLDIMMPEISGYEIMEKISKNPSTKNIPVIFVSALSESEDIIKGLELGSYDYITKPFKIDELKAKVQNVLRIKDLQDKLQNGKETLDKIYKHAVDAIVTIDNNFNITSCSDSFSNLFNSSHKELLGKYFCSLVDCDKNSNEQNPSTPIDNFKKEVHDIKIQGRIFAIRASEIKNNKNEIDGHIIVLRDVTELREIEKQKENFIATLTHDLKTPVRAEIRAIELLIDGHFGKLNNDQHEILKEILNSSNYMFMMIDSLLAKYKYDENKVILDKTFFSINNLIKECLGEVKVLYENKKQSVNIYFENLNEEINADFVEMKRTILNLLTNAIKYSEDYSVIQIKVFEENKNIKISFIDNGPGISDEEIKMIFDRYMSYSKKFRKVGTGLGLYISKKIASMHGGDITVESQEGIGSNFTLSIPKTEEMVLN